MNLDCIGSISYWITAQKAENRAHCVNHTFQKQSALSQFEIVASNGRQKLSVPTIKKTRKGAYSEVCIDYGNNWQAEHWRSIEIAYLKSPFYLYYGYKIEAIFKTKYTYLIELNTALAIEIYKCLKMDKTISIDKETPVYYAETKKQEHAIYPQVFDTKIPFEDNLSILDLLFNLGPETHEYLMQSLYKNPYR